MRGPFQNVLAVDEIAVEAIVPAPKGEPAGGYLKLERRVGDFATAGVAVSIDRVRGQGDEGRNRPHRCRRVDDLGRRRRARRWSAGH